MPSIFLISTTVWSLCQAIFMNFPLLTGNHPMRDLQNGVSKVWFQLSLHPHGLIANGRISEISQDNR